MTQTLRALALALTAALPAHLPSVLMAQSIACDPEGPQQAMNACAIGDFEAADAALNAAYKRAMAVAKDMGVDTQLRAAQRAWIPYRDAACATDADIFEGGSLRPLILYTCLAALTQERTRHLIAFEQYGDL